MMQGRHVYGKAETDLLRARRHGRGEDRRRRTDTVVGGVVLGQPHTIVAQSLGPFRLEPIRNVYASPVGAAGRIYITDLDGTTMVISHGGEPKVLAINRLEDSFSASAALVDKELVLRGLEYLYCIVE